MCPYKGLIEGKGHIDRFFLGGEDEGQTTPLVPPALEGL